MAWLFDELAQHDLPLSLINLGGGFPAIYRSSVPPIAAYGDAITRSLDRHFHSRGRTPRIIAEPGRYLVADAGVIATEVVLVARKAYTEDLRWVFVDIGRYGGLAETEGEAISYMISTPHDGGPTGPVVIAGPTCDSVDVMYEQTPTTCPWRWPRATSSTCCRPARTRAPTPASPSTASPRCGSSASSAATLVTPPAESIRQCTPDMMPG